MSAVRWIRPVIDSLGKCAVAAIGWLLVAPWAALMPRRRDRMTVMGRDGGKFIDNAKYFFLQGTPLLDPAVRVVFVTEHRDVVETLRGSGYEAMYFPSWPAVRHLLQSGTVIVDSVDWTRRMRRFLTVRARVLQLWHGVGFKRIELDKWRHEVSSHRVLSSPLVLALRKAMHVFAGRLVRYDAVNCTSVFYRDEVFSRALLSPCFPVTGYPRNTFGELPEPARRLVWRNVDGSISARLARWKEEHRRIVLVAPTFRDSRATPMGLTPDVLAMLDDHCEVHGIELVFKFHPQERQAQDVSGRHLHVCAPDSDLYPLMPASSALITDYSSIYMDYLLLDKPVLFLVPDLERYVREDRDLQFDFGAMTPGPKLASWPELAAELARQLDQDSYSTERRRLRQLGFDDLPQGNSVPALIDFMRGRSWLRETNDRQCRPA
jgi:hypothetical protein